MCRWHACRAEFVVLIKQFASCMRLACPSLPWVTSGGNCYWYKPVHMNLVGLCSFDDIVVPFLLLCCILVVFITLDTMQALALSRVCKVSYASWRDVYSPICQLVGLEGNVIGSLFFMFYVYLLVYSVQS